VSLLLPSEVLEALAPRMAAVALCACRLLPVCLLCPLLGGQSAPMTVRLGLVLALSLALHVAGGVGLQQAPGSVLELAALALGEVVFGTALGLIAAAPFDAARLGGRLVDLLRGTSAEASLPHAGTRETATGDGLYQLLVALAASGAALPLVVTALWRTFGVVGLGGAVPTEASVAQVVAVVGAAMAAGLAVGAPVAACSLAVDGALGLAARAAPGLSLQEVGPPLRILGGGVVLWLGLGVLCQRLLAEFDGVERALWALAGGAR
jgi:flagellar biosynthesis protein FliR